MSSFNSSSFLLLAVLLLLARVGGCSNSVGAQHHTSKIQSEVNPSPCEFDRTKDYFRDPKRCNELLRALREAAVAGNIDEMKAALKQGAEVDASQELSYQPALFAAIEHGQADAVKFLIEQGANVNANIADGYKPLQAVPASRPDIAAILVANGAKP